MRLNEITINKKEIDRILQDNFLVHDKYMIKDDGTISVDGNVWFRGHKELPVKFDVVHGLFDCKQCQLTTLEGCPRYVGGEFLCWQNNLKSLIGGPKQIGNRYSCYENPLESLEGLPLITKNGWILLDYNENLPLLRLLSVKNLNNVVLVPSSSAESQQLVEILMKYIGKGKGGILQCAAELTRAGYKGNARI